MNLEALKQQIRAAGGVVHSDGNIFFTSAMQFLRAASAAIPSDRAIALLPPHTEAGVQCECGDNYPADSWGAGFISAVGRCANCDAANGKPFESESLLQFTVTPSPDSQARNAAIREAMAAIAETESRKQALEIMEGMLKP